MRTSALHPCLAAALGLALLAPAGCGKKPPAPPRAAAPRAAATAPQATLTVTPTLFGADAAKMSTLEAADLAVSASVADYPVRAEADPKPAPAPDGSATVAREKGTDGYRLVLRAPGKPPAVIPGGHNGWLPQWSPDSKRVAFTTIDWKTRRRAVSVWSRATNTTQRAFSSRHGLGGLVAFTPDSQKVVFTYKGQAWIMNANGIGLAMLKAPRPVDEARAIGFTADGRKLALFPAMDQRAEFAPRDARPPRPAPPTKPGQVLTLIARP